MAMSNPGGSRGIGRSEHSARRYCTVAGHISGHHNLQHLQKAVLLGSIRIFRKVMSSSI